MRRASAGVDPTESLPPRSITSDARIAGPIALINQLISSSDLYEYGLPHAGLGSLPDMSILEVEHVFLDEDDEERGRRALANAKIFEVTRVTYGAGANIRVCKN